ncbi:unnamed protein product [Echinostoma caproni]|uniref:AIP3 domain-containing protein n=1 Tax=Echinostoma caproni TaxID=27848 RepID=A0A183A6T4_9TREM|nr:unnamed protein product [Echinostoma caproni]
MLKLEEKVVKDTRVRVIEPLRCILSHKRQQVSRLDTFRRNADSSLQEASDITAALHAEYCELYQVNRESLQLKSIKDILNGHNDYVLQLHMTNTMKEHYHSVVIPQLMQILRSEQIIVDKLVKSELQTKFDQLKKQFSELSSFMQQNRDVVETLENLEKRCAMARRPINYRIQQSLQRQTSVKSNESIGDERFTRLTNLRAPIYLGSPSSDTGQHSDRSLQPSSPFAEDGYPVQPDSLRTPEQPADPSIQVFREACEQGGIRIRINLEDSKRHLRAGNKQGETGVSRNTDTPSKTSKISANGNFKNQNETLKIIGSEKDTMSDVKFQVGGGGGGGGGGPPNIKGLWKRAFHSLRKDKGKREPSVSKRREPPSSSDEIDPVYHLLRCAASKSQSTAIATSGIGTPKTPVDRMKPNTLESPNSISRTSYGAESSTRFSPYASTGATGKKLSNVTFRSPYHGSLLAAPETDQRRDLRSQLDEPVSANAPAYSPARAISPNAYTDAGAKDAPVLLEMGEGILEGSAEDEKSREAQLAYEQHKRMSARRNMLKNTQKSLSFAVDEDGPDNIVKGRPSQAYNPNRLRPPLCERMKSLSVDDKNEIDDRKRWEDPGEHSIRRSPQFQIDPPAVDIRRHHRSEMTDRIPNDTVGSRPTGRESTQPPHYRTPEWHMDIQSQPNLDEHKPRNITYQPYPTSSSMSQSVGSKFPVGGSSSSSIYHPSSAYGRREHMDSIGVPRIQLIYGELT